MNAHVHSRRRERTARRRAALRWRDIVLLLVGLTVTFGIEASASAAPEDGNSLQSITPADGASVDQSPAEIVLSFNQELADDDTVTVNMVCNAVPFALGEPVIDADRLIVSVPLSAPAPRGSCAVDWQLADAEGTVITNGRAGWAVTSDPVQAPDTGEPTDTTTADTATDAATDTTTADTTPTSDATDTADAGSSGGAIWLGRLLSTIGILVVFGGLALISVGWPEGPEYVLTVRFLRGAWLVAMVGTLIYVIAFAADVAGGSFGSGVNPSAWLDLNDAGWAGRGALLRLVFITASGWVAVRPERIIDPTSAMWAWAIPGAALFAVAMSRVAGSVPLLGYLVNVVHVFAVAIWFGGAALVARVVLAGPGEEDLVQATRAFARISVPAILVASITGIIQVVRLDGGDLFGSSHGRVVLLKVVAVAAMIAVGLAARQQVNMRLDRAHVMDAHVADRFRRAFQAEAAIGLVVLAFSGWLLALTPPRVDPLADEVYLEPIPFNDTASGLQARVFVGPGRVGLNGVRVEVDAPAEGITNLRLRFIPPDPSAFIIEQPIDLTTSGTAVLLTAEGLPFDVPGEWALQVFASTASGVLEGAERRFLIADTEGEFVTVPTTTTIAPVDVEIVDQSTTTAPFVTTP